MPKLELSLKSDYLPRWTAYEGIREILQNGKDAEADGHALKVEHLAKYYDLENVLVVENTGASLPREALLFGHSTKVGNAKYIGQFGEGLKLGALCLVRGGHTVKVRTGSEVWTFSLEESKTYAGQRVVHVDIKEGAKPQSRVRVEISGVLPADWAEIRKNFRFLNENRGNEIFIDGRGTILRDPSLKGKVFVKGIFVQYDENLSCGYDLLDADIDRDRRMISSWDLSYKMRGMWEQAATQNVAAATAFFDQLLNNASDTNSVREAAYCDDKASEKVAEMFTAKFGDAVPVDNIGDAAELEHFGKRGVVVSKSLKAYVEKQRGTLASVKASLAKQTAKLYSWDELSDAEKTNLKRAVSLVGKALDNVSLSSVNVVDFHDAGLMGTFQATTDEIQIARRILDSRAVTLETMVHEFAHRAGGDGEHKHVAEIERIWSAIVEAIG